MTIVSGGQTGADRAGLDFAIGQGIPHGGWCPKGRKAIDGAIPNRYELRETPSANYPQRTEWNARDSDATVIFTLSETLTGGSKLTAKFADKHRKPWIHIHPGNVSELKPWLDRLEKDAVLNVAGSREPVQGPSIYEFTIEALLVAKA